MENEDSKSRMKCIDKTLTLPTLMKKLNNDETNYLDYDSLLPMGGVSGC